MKIRALLLVLVVAAAAQVPAASASPPLPSSMAAIGDSITRATDVCCWYGDHPRHSWSTGGWPFDSIRSHYERLRALNPAIAGRNFNDARAGARMRDAPGQAQVAVSQGAQYVTILMGANDACTDSVASMTPVAVFRAQFVTAIDTLVAGLPESHVFVSSIPNVYRLWELFRGDPAAQFVWTVAGICRSLLSPANTEAERQAVLARVQAFNQVLADVCAQYLRCLFDSDAVFNYPFTRTHVSRLDYFHPSLSGQGTLAALTWNTSWWG